MSSRHVEFHESRDKQWYFRLVGGNGEPLAVSERYTRREDAERGARNAFPDLYPGDVQPEQQP
jgi:uncharacterized protein YegP (UPF0339 family)